MSNKIVNYKTHRLEGVTFRYDEVFDWFVLSEFHCIRANEALTQEVMWHKNKMHHRIRDLAVKMQYQSNSKVSFVHVESLATRKAFYWYDQIRPKEVKDWARHLQSLFHQAVKKGGWNEVTDTTLRTWLKHEPGGSVRMISVSKDTYLTAARARHTSVWNCCGRYRANIERRSSASRLNTTTAGSGTTTQCLTLRHRRSGMMLSDASTKVQRATMPKRPVAATAETK